MESFERDTDRVVERGNNSASKSRAQANILAEVLFVFLPFIAMSIVFSVRGNFLEIFTEAEWSFAAAVLSGQAVVRLSSIVASRGPAQGSYLALVLAGMIVLILVPSLIVLVFVMTIHPVPLGLVIAQVVLFLLALLAFFFFGLIGDLIREGIYLSSGENGKDELADYPSDGTDSLQDVPHVTVIEQSE